MVRDAVTALIALLVSLPPLLILLSGLDTLLDAVRLPTYYFPLLTVLHAAACLGAWIVIALTFARLTGSLPTALFRTALAAFPVTLAWAFSLTARHPIVSWGAAAAPLLVAMLAHTTRLALVRSDGNGSPVVTRDDRGRAVACHAMAAIGALYVLASLWTVNPLLNGLRFHHRHVEAEVWVWTAILLLGIAIRGVFLMLARAPGSDPRYPNHDPIEWTGAGITLGLLGLAWLGWVIAAIRMAHSIGPTILAGLLHLAVLLLAVLAWLQLQSLLQRWRVRYGGSVQLDAFGCALVVAAGPLLIWLATVMTLIGGSAIAFWLTLTALLALAVGTPLAAYYLPASEHEPLARIVALALGCPFITSILALWQLPYELLRNNRQGMLVALAWITGLLIVVIVGVLLERRGFFDEFSGRERTTRNSRIDDGGPGDSMWRE